MEDLPREHEPESLELIAETTDQQAAIDVVAGRRGRATHSQRRRVVLSDLVPKEEMDAIKAQHARQMHEANRARRVGSSATEKAIQKYMIRRIG